MYIRKVDLGEFSDTGRLVLFAKIIAAVLIFSLILFNDKITLWWLQSSGIQISQSEYDSLKAEAKSRPNRCSQGVEILNGCYVTGAKGMVVKIGDPVK